jgi:DNA modification methylase
MTPYYADDQVTLLLGDALEILRALPDRAVNCIVTSPPYYCARTYGVDGQYGLEDTPEQYVAVMRAVFGEASRVLADDGTLWLNLGDNFESARESRSRIGISAESRRLVPGRRKSLLMIPDRVALGLCDDGWILRNKIVWHKTSSMPERVDDRLSRRHEPVFLFVKAERYFFDLDAIREAPRAGVTYAERKAAGSSVWHGLAGFSAKEKVPSLASHPNGANPGDVWSIAPARSSEVHYAVMSTELALRCIKAGCKPDGTVLDPFSGTGTTGAAARQLGRKYVGIDLNPDYHDVAKNRFAQGVLDVGGIA